MTAQCGCDAVIEFCLTYYWMFQRISTTRNLAILYINLKLYTMQTFDIQIVDINALKFFYD